MPSGTLFTITTSNVDEAWQHTISVFPLSFPKWHYPISEVVLPEYPTLMHLEFAEEVLPEHYHQLYAQGRVRAIADVHDPSAGLADCLVEFINQFDIKAKLIDKFDQTLNVHSLGSSQ